MRSFDLLAVANGSRRAYRVACLSMETVLVCKERLQVGRESLPRPRPAIWIYLRRVPHPNLANMARRGRNKAHTVFRTISEAIDQDLPTIAFVKKSNSSKTSLNWCTKPALNITSRLTALTTVQSPMCSSKRHLCTELTLSCDPVRLSRRRI